MQIDRFSLRQRVLGATMGWLLLVLVSAGMVVPEILRHYLQQEASQSMRLYLDELSARLEVNSQGVPEVSGLLSDPRFRQPYSGLYWQVTSPAGVLRSRSLWDSGMQESEGQWTGPKAQPLLRVSRELTLPDYPHPLTLVIAQSEVPLHQTLARLTHLFWGILAVTGMGILAIIGVLIGWSLKPLRRVQQQLTQVRQGHQTQLEGALPKELAPLAADLNALLFHYGELLNRARHHTGNLAHALKTPLAVLNNQIALLPPAEQAQLQAPLKQLREQIESHLARARIAGASNILAVRCQPALRVDRIALAMSKVYAARDVELINELDSELQLAVSEDDFDEMAGNLIENSFKWATSLIRVHLQASNDTSAESAMLTLLIDDDGCGIADADRERVLQRGVRLDETTPGSGLGLNIAYEMALSYRGDLRLQPSPLGGLRAELTLPVVRR